MIIGVVTATRAEYGVLRYLLSIIQQDSDCELCLIVTGTHLIQEYGKTISEIEKDNFNISKKVYVELATSSSAETSQTLGRYFFAFSDVFYTDKPDILIVIGDRYELIPICFSAVNAHIPIAHISGGEITEGAIDDIVRHCITKMSYLHFPGCEAYRQRIIQLGESPDRVFNFGDLGVENVKKTKLLTKQELEISIDFSLHLPYFSVTFHPVTQEDDSFIYQAEELLRALHKMNQYIFIITKANADHGGAEINSLIDKLAKEHNNWLVIDSLGIIRYLSMLNYSEGIIGNSSSGIIEAPCFGIPTINIGERQKGRLQAESIINCLPECNAIIDAVNRSQTFEFRRKAKNTTNPYGNDKTSIQILHTLKDFISNGKINLKKSFYDLTFNKIE